MLASVLKSTILAMVVFATSVSVCCSEQIDAYEVDIEELSTPEAIAPIEQHFSEIAEIRSLFANCKRCFRHVANAELRQLHASAKLTRPEFDAIEHELQTAVRKASLEICQDRLVRGQLQRSGWTGGNQLGHLAPITVVEDSLISIADEHIGEDRCQTYREAAMARREYRRTAIVEAMVASLDSRLFLKTKQRAQIKSVLMDEWQDVWMLCIRQLLNRGIEVMPLLPKQLIQTHLAEAQSELMLRLSWNPCTAPVVGPIELTMLGYQQKDTQLADELQFAPAKDGAK